MCKCGPIGYRQIIFFGVVAIDNQQHWLVAAELATQFASASHDEMFALLRHTERALHRTWKKLGDARFPLQASRQSQRASRWDCIEHAVRGPRF